MGNEGRIIIIVRHRDPNNALFLSRISFKHVAKSTIKDYLQELFDHPPPKKYIDAGYVNDCMHLLVLFACKFDPPDPSSWNDLSVGGNLRLVQVANCFVVRQTSHA